MKTRIVTLFFIWGLLITFAANTVAQVDSVLLKSDTIKSTDKIYIIRTNDGGEFIGTIIHQDSKEVLIETKDRGQISIPKYYIREMKLTENYEFTAEGEYIAKQYFSTRYFITTNGLPIEKGESYVQWNLYGPDFQFGIRKNLGVGIMTSWVGMPLIGTLKYTIPISPKTNLALGTLLGTGSWIEPDYGIVLPYAALTFGDRRRNLNLSLGYGAVFAEGKGEGRFLASVAIISKINKKISFVFDSFIMFPGKTETVEESVYNPGTDTWDIVYTKEKKYGFAILIPGLRFDIGPNKAFQFGFGGFRVDGEFYPSPIPMFQWYNKF
ncbi:hypothetical protein CYCD_01060 [Tenuifilaceae bacterium CYCD]|nr:hypothetical protein CYCD_01060 [Tenuifilaceae bacterium CYCD]